MKTLNFPTSACRLCRYYETEGRRGGRCQQLGVPVKGSWRSCSLALPPFAASWESLEEIWQDEQLVAKEALSVKGSLGSSKSDFPEEESLSTFEELTANIVLV